MGDYTQVTDFSAKDLLADSNPEKKILGSDMDAELALISTAIASKAELGAAETVTADWIFSEEVTFQKEVTFKKGDDVASANAMTLGDGTYFDITGTTTVNTIVTKGIGTRVVLHFDGALQLTHHATDMVLPGGANITTAAGDIAVLYEYASGDWRCVSYSRASGQPVGVTSTITELNYNDTGAAVGTVVASKTVTADANKDVASFRNVTLTGELDAATLDISGNADIDGTLETDALSIDGTTVTSTAAEINLIDGGTARGTTAVASGDGILINDDGTMRMTNVDTVSTYFSSHNVGGGNIVTTGALNSGSITSGFGTIDTGSSAITTTGLISGGSLDIDNVLINGTTIGHTDDTDLITLTDGVVTVAGELDATTLDISGNADIDGTTNLDAGDIDGAVQIDNTVTVGVDDTGYDVKFFGDTASAYMLWDTSDDDLILGGAARVVVPASGLVIGSTAVTSTAAELNILDGVTSTATELNIMDGDTSASGTTLADADRVVVNDAGTMKQVALSDFETYFESGLDTLSSVTTVGALNSGSITTGFGNIDNGASNITSGGLVKIDVDADADDLTGDSSTGRLTLGATEDLNLYHGGTNSYIVNDTGDLILDTADDIVLDAAGGDIFFKDSGTTFGSATNTSGNLIIKSGTTTALTFSGANITGAGTYTGSGLMTTGGNVVIPNAGNIGSASDTDAIAIASDGVVTFSQNPVFPDGGVAIADLDIDGGTDIGAGLADADLFIVDDGAGGANRKATLSRLKTYIGSAAAADDISAGDSAVTLTTTSGNITIDAAADNSDIIFKGTDGGSDITMLTLDGSEDGTATFKSDILIKDGGKIGSASDTDAIAIGSDGDVTLTQDLELQHDGAILSFGANDEVSLTHVHDTGILLNSTSVIQFNDASQNIGAPSDTVLDINATDEIELNATLVDINANVEISGTATTTGVHTFTAVPVFPNNTVETADIQADAITGAKIADDAIDSEHYTDGSIDAAHIASNAVTTAKINADAVTGAKIADDAIDSEHYTDGSIDTAHIADDAVTLAKMASGTDGNLISYDASGNPVAIATGNDGQVLTSTGAGSPPAFEDAAGGSSAADDLTTGDAAVTVATSSGNITIDAQGNDTDIIFKGTDNSSDITALTLDMSEAGEATFNAGIVVANDGNIGSASDKDAIAISSGGVVTMNQIPVFSAGLTVSGGTLTIASEGGGNTTNATQGVAKAWINYKQAASFVVNDSFNIGSVDDDGAGAGTTNYSTAFNNANYSANGGSARQSSTSDSAYWTFPTSDSSGDIEYSTSATSWQSGYSSGTSSAMGKVDCFLNMVTVHGDLA